MRLFFSLVVTATSFLPHRVFARPVTGASSAVAFLTPFVLASRIHTSQSSPQSVINMTGADPNSTASSGDGRSCNAGEPLIDLEYPGTAVERMHAARARVAELAANNSLHGTWEEVRRQILWAGGLKDLPNAIPGQGYTGHSFNDFNHVDLTTMRDDSSNNRNDGQVKGIAIGNQLGPGIRFASMAELGPGGSWSTCAMGCNSDPPRDVAHIQFRSRIAFKLVWVPNDGYDTFVLVDDDGNELAKGKPIDGLPGIRERKLNYKLVQGSKYARAAEAIASNEATE